MISILGSIAARYTERDLLAKNEQAYIHSDAVLLIWTLPRAKNCSPALNFCTSVRTGAVLSNPSIQKKKVSIADAMLTFLVGVSGFEPEASWTRTKRDTKLRHTPIPKAL